MTRKSFPLRSALVITGMLAAGLLVAGLFATGCNSDRPDTNRLVTRTTKPTAPEIPDALAAPPTKAEAEEAAKRADRAIQAQGGAERLAKIRVVKQKTSGLFDPVPEQKKGEQELVIKFPDQIWVVNRVKYPQGTTAVITVAVDGKTGWRQQGAGAAVDELKPDLVETIRSQLYLRRLAITLPLKDEGVTLQPLAEAAVEGKPAFGLRVFRSGAPTADLYFDAQTALLVKLVALVPDAGVKMLSEMSFYDHKPFDGVTLPTKIRDVRDRALCMDLDTVGYEFPATFDPNVLAKPKVD